MSRLAQFRRGVEQYGFWRALRISLNYVALLPYIRWPKHGRAERRALKKVLKSRAWGGIPPRNPNAVELAERFAKLHTARFGIPVVNGSLALTVAYKALQLQRDDEIIVPALTFATTAGAALELGIRPVFVDVDPRTMCIDVEAAARAITPRTKAIAPVHLGAQMADMDAVLALAEANGLRVIEDCAHAHGAMWGDRGAGSLGDLGTFSFQLGKTMTAGEGGMILTNDELLADRCLSYVNCGRPASERIAPQSILGTNLRMTEFQCAVLLAQLERLPAQTRRRDENARRLTAGLAEVEGVTPLRPYDRLAMHGVYGYYFRMHPEACGGVDKDTLVLHLKERGIPASACQYLPVTHSAEFGWHDAPIEVDYEAVVCPVAERAALQELVWIPHPVLLAPARQMDRIVTTIDELLRGYRAREAS